MRNLCKRTLAALIPLLALPSAAFSGDVYTPPEGCTAFLTVQSAACEVDILWQCDLAPAGDKWDAYFDQNGLQSIASYSGQYAWLDAEYYWDNSVETATGTPTDPISLAVLFLTGRDTYAFDMQRTDENGTRILHVSGEDYVTPQDVTIDGLALQTTHFDVTITEGDGSVFYHAEGEQLYAPDHQVFFSDRVISTFDGETTTFESPPVDFIFPGEAGFADPTPQFGCNVTAPDTAKPVETGTGQNNNK